RLGYRALRSKSHSHSNSNSNSNSNSSCDCDCDCERFAWERHWHVFSRLRHCAAGSQPLAKPRKPVESRFLFARRLERWQPATKTESAPDPMNAHVK
ncbi:hypothetical protein ACR1QG_20970, partial [Pseudomonas fulva]